MATFTEQKVNAIYKDGKLLFSKPELAPRDGTEVVVTFVRESPKDKIPQLEALQSLRGRGRGEGLVKKLLAARKLDREREQHA